jgi:hypothetical protein
MDKKMSKTTNDTEKKGKVISMQDIKARAMDRHLKEPLAEKINYLHQLAELISAKLFRDIKKSRENGDQKLLFLNLWTIKWNESAEGKISLSSSCSATSSARNISNKFRDNGGELNASIHEYFYSVLSKPPGFIDFLAELSDIAKQNLNLNDKSGGLTTGRHLAYLFNVLFSEILEATYQDGLTVKISSLGTFEKKLKINKRKGSEKEPVGYLQFTPEII